MPRHWIAAACHRDREPITEPFGDVLFCVRHLVATNEHGLLAVPDSDAPTREHTPKTQAVFPTTPVKFQIETTIAELRAWASEGLAAKHERCNGTGKHVCSCGSEHDCYGCGGTGYEDGKHHPPSENYGAIGECVVNRAILSEMFSEAPDGPVLIVAREWADPVSFTGDGWIGLLIGCRHDDDDKARAKPWGQP